MRRLYIVLIIAITLLTGCVRRDAVRFNGISKVNIESAGLSNTRISCNIGITNNMRRDLTITEVKIWAFRDEQKLALVSLVDSVTVPARSEGMIRATFSIKFSSKVNFMELLALGSQLESLEIEGDVMVRKGGMSHKIRVKRMALKDFLANFS